MEWAFREETVKRSKQRIDDFRSTKFPTYNRDAHPIQPTKVDLETFLVRARV
jgi:hypothetical protein